MPQLAQVCHALSSDLLYHFVGFSHSTSSTYAGRHLASTATVARTSSDTFQHAQSSETYPRVARTAQCTRILEVDKVASKRWLQLTYTMRSGSCCTRCFDKGKYAVDPPQSSGWMPSSFQRGMIFLAAPFQSAHSSHHSAAFLAITNRIIHDPWHRLSFASRAKGEAHCPDSAIRIHVTVSPPLQIRSVDGLLIEHFSVCTVLIWRTNAR